MGVPNRVVVYSSVQIIHLNELCIFDNKVLTHEAGKYT